MTKKDNTQFRYSKDENVDLLLENYSDYGEVNNSFPTILLNIYIIKKFSNKSYRY
jgi:hypothetical protein